MGQIFVTFYKRKSENQGTACSLKNKEQLYSQRQNVDPGTTSVNYV